MSRTIRKDRRDVKYPEGQSKGRYVYKCKCSRCINVNKNKANAHEKNYKQQLKQIEI